MAPLLIAVIVLQASSNALEDLMPLVPGLLAALQHITPGEVVRIGG